MNRMMLWGACVLLAVGWSHRAQAQRALSHNTFSSGVGVSEGGSFSLTATFGQSAVGTSDRLSSGFWSTSDTVVPTSSENPSDDPAAEVPHTVFQVAPNHPNPFRTTTRMAYTLPQQAHVTVRVHNVLGQEIITLLDGARAPGAHSLTWNGEDQAGRAVPSGVYFFTVEAGDLRHTRLMVLRR